MVSYAIKKKVGADQKWNCNHCQELLDETYEVDHIHPRHLGGTDDPQNLQALCPHCHRKKTFSESTKSKSTIIKEWLYMDPEQNNSHLKFTYDMTNSQVLNMNLEELKICHATIIGGVQQTFNTCEEYKKDILKVLEYGRRLFG